MNEDDNQDNQSHDGDKDEDDAGRRWVQDDDGDVDVYNNDGE